MYTFANNLVHNKDGVPEVVSISWGWSETQQCTIATDCSTLGVNSEGYVKRVNAEFQKLGVMGVSLFVASGDSGANGRTDEMCTDKVLHAGFPASSPYVTTVGATQLKTATTGLTDIPVCKHFKCATGGTEESVSYAVAGFTSGGGFSNISAMPAYQKAVVEAYLSNAPAADLPPKSMYNAGGRGYPDVSAMGNNFLIMASGSWGGVGGTSASAPTWGGIAGRLVDISLEITKKPLGFMNPLLYKMHAEHPMAFNDITIGDNKCTESGCAASCKGFGAANGWDAVSGLGTPDFAEMAKYLKAILKKGEAEITV